MQTPHPHYLELYRRRVGLAIAASAQGDHRTARAQAHDARLFLRRAFYVSDGMCFHELRKIIAAITTS